MARQNQIVHKTFPDTKLVDLIEVTGGEQEISFSKRYGVESEVDVYGN